MVKFTNKSMNRHILILGSLATAIFCIFILTQALIASETEILPPDLSESTKTVNKEQAHPGSTLQYEIVVKNTGNQFAIASVTDTLAAELTYVPGSLAVQTGGDWGEAGNVITWTGVINSNSEIIIRFQAVLDEALEPGDFVTNTADIYLEGDETPVQPNVVTFIVEKPLGAYLPFVFKPLPIVTANPIVRTSVDNSWTVSWNKPSTSITGFEIQEAQNPSFTGATTLNVGSATSRTFAHNRSFNNQYYYRVRGLANNLAGPWSNIVSVAGNYRDDFQDSNSGWATRRTNTESGDVKITYRSDDVLEVSLLDDNEYVLLSPLRRAPQLPVKFEMEAEINGADGSDIESGFIFSLIFGADWDGGTCTGPSSAGCFNNYYRLRFRWTDGNPDMEFRLDWVEDHSSGNRPENTKLIDWTGINENVDPDDWLEVDALVEADGDIKIFFRDERIGTVRHSRIVSEGFDPYFGLGVSTENNPDARMKFRYYEAEKAVEN